MALKALSGTFAWFDDLFSLWMLIDIPALLLVLVWKKFTLYKLPKIVKRGLLNYLLPLNFLCKPVFEQQKISLLFLSTLKLENTLESLHLTLFLCSFQCFNVKKILVAVTNQSYDSDAGEYIEYIFMHMMSDRTKLDFISKTAGIRFLH